ncbi:MAG: hypothetical protein ACM3YN_13560 [Parcubacteria group bacterium]
MSVLDQVLSGIRDAILLSEKVERLSQNAEALALELRDHDRRLVRLETMVEMAQANAARGRLAGPEGG